MSEPHPSSPPQNAVGAWAYGTLDIVRWHFSATDAVLLACCGLTNLFCILGDCARTWLVRRP